MDIDNTTPDDTTGLPPTGQSFSVPDEDINADLDLQDEKDQALQDAYSDETAAESVGIPEADLKEGLDKIAFDEQEQAVASTSDDATDDWREHVEDLNENDKDQY